ncbi:MAG: acyl carrier protein [Fibrobacter sp.]|nr:acyl carrier protein [Fibrobacter sp.]
MNKDQIFNKVSEILTTYLRLAPDEVQPESHIVNDLGADSLAMVEIGFLFTEAFEIPMINPSEKNMIIKYLVDEIEASAAK